MRDGRLPRQSAHDGPVPRRRRGSAIGGTLASRRCLENARRDAVRQDLADSGGGRDPVGDEHVRVPFSRLMRFEAKTSMRPSGENIGKPSNVGLWVTCSIPVPSTFTR